MQNNLQNKVYFKILSFNFVSTKNVTYVFQVFRISNDVFIQVDDRLLHETVTEISYSNDPTKKVQLSTQLVMDKGQSYNNTFNINLQHDHSATNLAARFHIARHPGRQASVGLTVSSGGRNIGLMSEIDMVRKEIMTYVSAYLSSIQKHTCQLSLF